MMYSDQHMERILHHLESGLVLTRYFLKKKPENLTLCVKLETQEVILIKSVTQHKPEGTIDLRTVKEIRPLEEETYVKEFEKAGIPPEQRQFCLSIHYGQEFVLKQLAIQAPNLEHFQVLYQGLSYLMENTNHASFVDKVDRWLHKEFCEIARNKTISFTDMKKWLTKSYMKVSGQKLKECWVSKCNLEQYSDIGFDQFATVYKSLVYTTKLVKKYFGQYLITDGDGSPGVPFNRLTDFLQNENHLDRREAVLTTQSIMADVANTYLGPNAAPTLLYAEEFLNYLFSLDNSVWNSEYTREYQDMTHPISHYYIASSHNTYLQGDQFKSNSSTEAYVQCLCMGAKCIELDCWDGPDGWPYIYHGHTLTSKIKFIDVLKTIKKYAWVRSEYPLILSIENHCCIQQQRNMAAKFLEIFGDELLTQPIDKNAACLPSPEQLRRKIILKNKKLSGENDWKLVDDSDDPSDISQSRHNGLLYLQDPGNPDEWNAHFFVLNDTTLYFTNQTNGKTDQEDDDDVVSMNGDVNGLPENVPATEAHLQQTWFHGRLADGRRTSENLLRSHSHLGPGCFLVRESEAFVGSYTLSFWQQDKVNHSRIKSTIQNGITMYYLVENLMFPSLYELITHYKSNHLKTPNFEMVLQEPVPKVASPLGKSWYHDNIDKLTAEDWLARIVKDGAFLIRRRSPNNNNGEGSDCTISFRADGKVKHCRIYVENGTYVIGSAAFDSLPELVSYYQKYPLYRRMKLRYPVNKEVFDHCKSEELSAEIYGSGIYTQPNEVQPKNQYRAMYDYTASRTDELTFKKGAIISNVARSNAGWWLGDCNGETQKWFPCNYVEDLEASQGLGSLEQGSIVIDSNIRCDINSASGWIVYGRGEWCRQDLFLQALLATGQLRQYTKRFGTGYMSIYNKDLHGPIDTAVSDAVEKKKLFMFIIKSNDEPLLKVAAATPQEVQDWVIGIHECVKRATTGNARAEDLQKRFQLAREFSDLVIYCRSTPYNPSSNSSNYYEMTSFSELQSEKICTKKDDKGRQFVSYNRVQFSRVYPKGQRIDSSNYDPILPWSCGAHMSALNYQTPDKAMQINQGRFMQNGLTGFVLKPTALRIGNYNPFDKQTLASVEPVTITLLIIAGRHLFKDGKGIPSPFVEVEILGDYYEVSKKFKTKTRQGNGLMPIWNEAIDFDVEHPDFAMIRFCVQDEDVFGDPNFLGHATIPITCLRSGYRSIPLQNDYSQDLELASLLVKIDIVNSRESQDPESYEALNELKEHKLKVQEELNEAVSAARRDELCRRLNELETSIDAKLDHRRRKFAMTRGRLSVESRTSVAS